MTLCRSFKSSARQAFGGIMRASGRSILSIACGVAAGVALLAGPAHAGSTQAGARHVTTYTMRSLGTLGGRESIPYGISGHTVVGFSTLPGDLTYHAVAFDLKTGTVTDLGTLGGSDSRADAIRGDIAVGSSQTTGDTATHAAAFNLDTGAIIDLGTLGGTSSGAGAIRGDIAVGWSQTTGDTARHAAAFNLDTGAITDLGPDDTNSGASAIAGDMVVGNSYDGLGDVIPFAYDLRTGVRTDLAPTGGEVFAADGHFAVGDSGGQAVAYDLRSGKVTDLGQLAPSRPSTATAVSGHFAAGYAVTNGSPSAQGIPNHAVAYNLNTAKIIDIGTLGGSGSIAQAVSGHTVVGVADTTTTSHGFAYNLNTGVMTDLGSLDGVNTFSTATLIAPDGVILGWSTTFFGGQYAVAWTP
jgi:uncharacterized membrane protein